MSYDSKKKASVCGWCATQLADPKSALETAPYGICEACAGEKGLPIEDLSSAPIDLLDQLPFGVIRIDDQGKILAYNRTESKFSRLSPASVVGKNFFRDIAPCARVKEFAGELDLLQKAHRNAKKELTFAFKFPHGSMVMNIVLLHDVHLERNILLVRPVDPSSPYS